jgi:hypothetical protein
MAIEGVGHIDVDILMGTNEFVHCLPFSNYFIN